MSADAMLSQHDFTIGDPTGALDILMRYSGDCVKVLDLDGHVLKWNPACEEVYGWTAREVLGTVLPYVPDELRLRVLVDLRSIAGAGRITERESEAIRADGSRTNMRLVIVPLIDDDGDPAGLMAISREMLADGRLERQRADFTESVGRGLREPLSTIANAATLLVRPEIASDADRRARLARALVVHARGAADLVDDLLLTSLLSEDRLVLDREPRDVGVLVGDVVATMGDDGRRLVLDFDPSLPPALVDGPRLSRAVVVLVRNALNSSGHGNHVQVSVYRRGGSVAIEVRDEGEPVDPREAPLIFDRHYAGPEMRGAHDVGTGLYLVQGIVRAHGGTVTVSSPPAGGAAFTITLPLGSHEPVLSERGEPDA